MSEAVCAGGTALDNLREHLEQREIACKAEIDRVGLAGAMLEAHELVIVREVQAILDGQPAPERT